MQTPSSFVHTREDPVGVWSFPNPAIAERWELLRWHVGGWIALSALVSIPVAERMTMEGASSMTLTTHMVLWAALGIMESVSLSILLTLVPRRLQIGVPAVFTGIAVVFFASMTWGSLLELLSPLQMRPPRAGSAFVMLRGIPQFSLWLMLFSAFTLRRNVNAEREKRLRLEALLQVALLDVLRSQLNPHFLFNALNSVTALITVDPPAARKMVTDLSSLLRRSLQSGADGMCTVAAELDFIRTYVACEKVRFEDNLLVEIDVDPALLGRRIPVMLLHPLVENAVKHGMRTSALPLRVDIHGSFDDEGLVHFRVRNTGKIDQKSLLSEHDLGVGMRTIKERTLAISPEAHGLELEPGEGSVTAHLWFRMAKDL